MSRANEDKVFEKLKPVLTTEPLRRFKEYLDARVETHRDLLEIEESTMTRGALKECRQLLKLFNE